MPGLGIIVREYGFWVSLAAVFVPGLLTGWLAFKISKAAQTGNPLKKTFGVILLQVIMFQIWSYTFYDAAVYGQSSTLKIIFSFLASILLYAFISDAIKIGGDDSRPMHLWHWDKKGVALVLISFGYVGMLMLCSLSVEINLLDHYPDERAAYYQKQILERKNDANERSKGFTELARYEKGTQHQYAGVVTLIMGRPNDASGFFAAHARELKDAREQAYWTGMAHFYAGRFAAAEVAFARIGDDTLTNLLRYTRGTLSKAEFEHAVSVKKLRVSPNVQTAIRSSYPPAAAPVQTVKTPKIDPIQAAIKELTEELRLLKTQLEKGSQPPPPPPQPQVLRAQALTLINEDVFSNVTSHINKQRKVVKRTTQPNTGNLFVALIGFPIYAFCMMIGLSLAQAYDGSFLMKRLEASWVKTKSAAKRLSFHSGYAERLCVRIALAEHQKGLYAQEIQRIRTAVFPADLVLGLIALRQAKKTGKAAIHLRQQSVDLSAINRELHLLVGRLIPLGDAQSLQILTALNKRADQALNQFLKAKATYGSTRDLLLNILQEIATVGDILDARRSHKITYYSLLGINQDASIADVKKAYREIINAVHPDRHQGSLIMQSLAALINEAYSALNNEARRSTYDCVNKY